MTKKKSILDSNLLYTIIAIILGFVVGAIFLVAADLSPAVVYAKLIDSIFGKSKYMIWTLVYATPIIFTGISVAFSFKTGVFNIGAEGQYVLGAVMATVIGIAGDGIFPPIIHPIVCILAAAAAGALWAFLVGLMKVKKGIHEVLSFIMFNWIAFYFSNYVVNTEYIHKEGGGEASKDVAQSAMILLPESWRQALDCKSAHWGFVLAIICAVTLWFILERTSLGYNLRAVGYNKNAAEFAGINSNKSILTSLAISGAMAGIGGAVQILGMAGRLAQYAGQEGYGFQGITVALIGASNPLACILSGIFYGAMKYGGTKLTLVKAPSEIIDIIMGCVIIFIAIAQVFKFLFKKLGKKEA